MKKSIKGWITPTSLKIAITVTAVALGFVFGGVLASDAPTQTARVEVTEATPQPPNVPELFRLTNEERAKAGAKPLELNPLLNKSAQMKADDMFSGNYLNHHNPVTNKSGVTYISDVGADCYIGGENLTQNIHVNDSKSAINAWLNSESHKAALLSEQYEQVGYGISGNYIVQHFCDISQ